MSRAMKALPKSHAPQYSIQLVARASGVSADALRMWERRYGFPDPTRDDRGNRMYSQEDIARLQQVKRALQAGFKPAEVVPKPAAEIAQLLSGVAQVDKAREAGPSGGSAMAALLSGDATSIRLQIRRAALALGPEDFVVEYAAPLVEELGRLWAAGRLEVHEEHLVTDLLCTQLRAVWSSFDDGGVPVVALTTLSGEHHELGMWMAAVYLASKRATVRVLGPNLPAQQIALAVGKLQPHVVAVSISPAADLAAVRLDLAWLLSQLPHSVELWAGGKASGHIVLRDRRFRAIPSWQDLEVALSTVRRAK